MAPSPIDSPVPEWQLWAYRIKIELQENINAFDDVLKEFQQKMASIDDGLNSRFDTLSGDVTLKGADINSVMLDVTNFREEVKESRTKLAEQERRLEAFGEELAMERTVTAKRYKEQITINKNVREDMQRAANHLTDLQMQAKQDSDRKENDIAILKAENEAIWPQLEELKATIAQLTSVEGEQEEEAERERESQQDERTGRHTDSGPWRKDLTSSDDPANPVSSPLQSRNPFTFGQDRLGDGGRELHENGHPDSQVVHFSTPQDPRRFSSELQLATRGHKSYKDYIRKGAQEARAALEEEMKQLEEMYGKKFIWNIGDTPWRSQLWQELEETGWNWENVEARAMRMLEEKQKPRKRSRQYLEY